MIEIPLKIGGPAIIDDQDFKAIKAYLGRWTWHAQGKGVTCYLKNQVILMHNLISPKARVSFIDGDKRNCRRENLIGNKPLHPLVRKSRKGDMKFIFDDKKQKRLGIRRNLDYKGVRYVNSTSISYRNRDFDDVLVAAKEKAKQFESMSLEEFIESSLQAKNRKTTNQIVSEWDCFQGRELSYTEYYQSGVTSTPDSWK